MTRCLSLVLCAAFAALPLAEAASGRTAALGSRQSRPLHERRAAARPPADVPVGHWAYPLLERLVGRGLIEIDLSTLPVSRSDVARALEALEHREASGAAPRLSRREAWAVEILRAEFLEGEVDEPLARLRDGPASVGLGLMAGLDLRGRSGDADRSDQDDETSGRIRNEDSPAVDVDYEFWGGLAERLGFYSDATILLEEQNGPRAESLGSRARTWRGFVVSIDRAYVSWERPHVRVSAGRRDAAWGRSPWGRLLLSGTAPTLDDVEARFTAGPLTFTALHAVLEPSRDDSLPGADLGGGARSYLAAHRIVAAGRWGSVGLSEAVVYTGDVPDPAYLNPLLPYYVAQHNEREDDNVLWSMDFVALPGRGLEAYGEFLVDDLQYERDTGHPDKYGVTFGVTRYGVLGGRDLETTAEYSNVRKWTYTHHVPGHAFEQDGRPLGFDLGPDADRMTLDATWHAAPTWAFDLRYVFSRKGAGTISVPFEEGQNPEPTFPSGEVTSTGRVSIDVLYEAPGRLSAWAGVAYEDVSIGGGGHDNSWEIRAGFRFRI